MGRHSASGMKGASIMNMTIRRELPADRKEVENITREAFWNLYVRGCSEHYIVHKMRNHDDFISALDYVAIVDNRIVGNIMYVKSSIMNEMDVIIDTISFGPVSVLPEYQRKGIGSALIRKSVNEAKDRAYKAVIIYGHPKNYCKHGFRSSKDYDISNIAGKYPYSLLVLPLVDWKFEGHKWKFVESEVYNCEENEVEEFDKQFVEKKKEYRYTQEEFGISVRAYIE
jgi:predicted N-acetyltransferase YhbS